MSERATSGPEQTGDRVAGGESDRDAFSSGITTFLGWFAGIAALAYTVGVRVYWLRLEVHGVPSPAVTASSLPREMLVATSASTLGLLVLGLGGGYLLIRLLRGGIEPPEKTRILNSRAKRRSGKKRIRSWLALSLEIVSGLILSSILILMIYWSASDKPQLIGIGRRFVIWNGLVIFIALCLGILVREALLLEYGTQEKYNRPTSRFLFAFVYVAAFLPWTVVQSGVKPLPHVTVCAQDPAFRQVGLLIGSTADAVYVAQDLSENQGSERRQGRFYVIPSDSLVEVVIGQGSRWFPCPEDEPSASGTGAS